MYPNRNLLAKAIEIIAGGSSGVICLSQKGSTDTVAAATALYLGLTKLGKNVAMASSANIQSDLVGADKIQPNISTSGNNLVISFPYQDGSIDKVDYYIQGDRFNIVLAPSEGQNKINPKQVNYSYSGGTVDFIITIDCETPRALGDLYEESQDLFKQAKIINVDRHLTNAFFGQANLVNKSASSSSELVLTLLEALKVPLDKEIATNLYAGLTAATNNFSSYSVNPQTFENAAYLLKAGAQKKGPRRQTEAGISAGPIENQIFSQKAPKFEKTDAKPIEEIETEEMDEENQDDDDWLKPKIFDSKGSSGGGETS